MRRLTLPALLAASCAVVPMAHAQTREVLPTNAVPSHYDLAFHPDLAAHRFTATNTVTLEVTSATPDITLNAKGLIIEAASLENGAQGTTTLDPKLERATIHFAAPVAPGRHVLTIAYHGAIGTETLGLFGMDYEGPGGGKATIMATNLEPASARQVFPGWDEPAIKATYTVSVDAPKAMVAVSNMPVASSVAISSTANRVTFAQSPKMSSYLFFLGLGDWERLHKTVDGVDVGVMVKRGDAAKGAYALDQAAALLHWYNGYFGTPYPLPKLDLIAAPGAIQGGSMENWGAIFYSQEHLLFDPAKSTEGDRQLVFEVVAHEMAHQWFGDLVTMAWWDNLWLNEGFARWMQTRAADALHPQWQTGLRAQTIFESGREADALPSSHPIIQPILTANQASQAFDEITYDKGAAVITMLIADIGEDHFRNGLQRYMKAHAYGNTVDADLWSIMQQEAGKPILAIEHDFTTQAGVPLIRVSATAKGLDLAEDRFLSSGPTQGPAQRWQIPLTVRPLAGKGMPFSLDGAGYVAVRAPALVNAGQTAYARVLYPQPVFEAMMPGLAAMAPVDQVGLLQDAAALGNSGYAPASNILEVATHIPASADPLVWERVTSALVELDDDYDPSPRRDALRARAIALLKPVLARLGKAPRANDGPDDAILRAQLIRALGRLGDAATVEEARALHASGKGTAAERNAALAIVGLKATPADFDALLAKARATADPLEKLRFYRALASAEDAALAPRIADIVLGKEVPAGTSPALIATFARAHPDLAWKLVVPRLGEPAAGMNPQMQWEEAMVVAGQSADLARIADYRAYLAAKVPADAQKAMMGAIGSIELNHKVATQALPDIDRWLATHPS